MADVSWLPDSVGLWADRDPNQRTFVPFAIAGVAFSLCAVRLLGRGIRSLGLGMVCALVLLVVAETGQFFVSTRGPSFGDLRWGVGGILVGALLVIAGTMFFPTKPTHEHS